MSMPAYYTAKDKIWHYTFRVICYSIFFFLLAPILIMIPLSFNAQPFFHIYP